MVEAVGSIPFIVASAEAGEHHVWLSYWGLAAYVGLVVGSLFGLMAIAKRGINNRIFKNPVTQLFEQLYLFIEGMCVGTIGAHGRRYIPMIMTLWMIIFTGNIIALFFPSSPTADLSFNLAMAVVAIAYVQYEGARINGVFGHISHFAGPRLGWMLLPITLMIFVIEVVSELMKNVSLSLRLYGNMSGGHSAVEAMNKLGEAIYVPVGAFLLPIKLLTCVVQALIFTLLTCVYLSLVTHKASDHDQEGKPAAAH